MNGCLWAIGLWCGAAPVPDVTPPCCGRHALGAAACYLGVEGPLDRLLPADHAPYSFADLEAAARGLNLDAFTVRWDDPRAADLNGVCILHVRAADSSAQPDHFVVCFGSDPGGVLLGNYPQMPMWVARDKLDRYWSGAVLYVDHRGSSRLRQLRWQIRLGAWRWSVAVLIATAGVGGTWLARKHSSRGRRAAGSVTSTAHIS